VRAEESGHQWLIGYAATQAASQRQVRVENFANFALRANAALGNGG